MCTEEKFFIESDSALVPDFAGIGSRSVVDAVDRILNFVLALLLFLLALPVLVLCYLFYLLMIPKPRASFLYSGERLGRNFKPYVMYKIRTLREDAVYEKLGEILQGNPRGVLLFRDELTGFLRSLELAGGKFLRNSRLDELPQLWNVIRGDMNLVGPRPLRRAVYEQLRYEIPNCETRFRVKPGLTGYAQFLTPSHTPKRIRFAIDNYWTEKGRRPFRDLFLIVWTARSVIRRSVLGLLRTGTTHWQIVRHRGKVIQERKMERERSKYIWIQMTNAEFSSVNAEESSMIHIYDINPRAVSFYSKQDYPRNSTLYFYLIGCKECETGTKKRARCVGSVYKIYPEAPGRETGPRYVVFYEPVSPRHRYLVDHYVLHETVA